eukprot:TRINITY_DN6648_c0_g4_i1.p1 TRINITY_DN6648_c0_g4~~TRINITY_DN6648_c0_g4_i1.p1  ORF type:complete len:638 (-),score=73.37 TRINITY_DN6648_c0_g4_i1:28-1941(-)
MASLSDIHCDVTEPFDALLVTEPFDAFAPVHSALNWQRQEIMRALEDGHNKILASLHSAIVATSTSASPSTPRSQEEDVLFERRPNPPTLVVSRKATEPVLLPTDRAVAERPTVSFCPALQETVPERDLSADASASLEQQCTAETGHVSDRLEAELSTGPDALRGIESEAMASVQSRASKKPSTRIRQLRRQGTTTFGGWLRTWVHSPAFELGFAMLIGLNTLVMACQLQYSGIDVGHQLDYPSYDEPASSAWPGALDAFYWLEVAFGIVFTAEVCTKLLAERVEFLCSLWNYYDVLIISFWMVQLLSDLHFAVSPMLMRLARVARLMRLLRFVRAFQVFDVLHLLVHSLLACMSAFCWSMILLLLVMCVCALAVSWALESILEDESRPLEQKQELFRYFGTFSRGMLSMYEITLGNWVPITRFLTDEVSEMYSLLVMLYRAFVGFAVLKVIGGIFLHETFRVAASDDDIMIMQRERAVRKHSQRMMTLLREADDSDDGYLSLQEFRDILTDARVQKWLAAQEIEVKDADLVFQMVDDEGDQRLSPEELVRGFARLKGPAKSMDLAAVIHATLRMEQRVTDVLEGVMRLQVDPALRSEMPRRSQLCGPLVLGTSVSANFVNAYTTPRAPEGVKNSTA